MVTDSFRRESLGKETRMPAPQTIIPPRLFTSILPSGQQEFFCYLALSAEEKNGPQQRWRWHVAKEAGGEALLGGMLTVGPQETDVGRVAIAALLPPHWAGGHLLVEDPAAAKPRRWRWPIERFRQEQRFCLPLQGQVLILVGHRIAEVHRAAWQIPSQHFAWDMLPLASDGLRLLNGELGDDLHAELFAAFGQEVLAPAAGHVVRAVGDFPDLQRVGQLPDAAFYLQDLNRAAGNHAIIDHGRGIYSFLTHLRRGSLLVESGQEVEAGSVIGRLGNSGFSSGPHLHLHFMDGPDPLRASPLPVALDLEGGTYEPQAGEIVSG